MKAAQAGAVVIGLALLIPGLLAGSVSLPSYLAGWLFWASLPIGALPVVMILDMAGPGAGFGLGMVLRRLLWLLPLAAVMMIPILLWPATLFGWAGGHGFDTPFAHLWMSRSAFTIRSIVYFVIWAVLSLLFVSEPLPTAISTRRSLAMLGLAIYLATATLASVDWVMTVEPHWMSADFGLLFVSTQIVIAVSVAVLLAGGAWRRNAPSAAATFLLAVAAVWLFMQFMQFLVIWSADKPSDIMWYVHRANLWGRIMAGLIVLAGMVVPLALLLSPRGRHTPVLMLAAVLAMLTAQAFGWLWLITPSLRQHFTVLPLDVLDWAGLGGITVGAALFMRPVAHA
jgi:hypothetical protein